MSALSKSVLFLLPFGKQMGVGHLLRQVVLAKAFRQKGYTTIMWSAGNFDEIPAVFAPEACDAFDQILRPSSFIDPQSRFPSVAAVKELEQIHNLAGVIIDDYRVVGDPLRRQTLEGVRELSTVKGARIAMFDGLPNLEFDLADIVVNLELAIDRSAYDPQTLQKMISGMEYALLREGFHSPEAIDCKLPENPFLVMIGGTDPQNCSLALLKGLKGCGYNPVLVANAKMYSADEVARLNRALGDYPQSAWLYSFTPGQMRTLLDNCCFSFVGCGTGPIWEHFVSGCPMVGVLSNPTLAENASALPRLGLPAVRAVNHDELMRSWGNPEAGITVEFDSQELLDAIAQLDRLGYLAGRLPDASPFDRVSLEGAYNMVAKLNF